ncbi:hypothetical protein SUNI508_08169 [Seiridium unicorne]|uniref:Uncharacterized protein n=1 Tax=Seiridium unicorne TaxID=138068 RepID=A0ABR2UUZ3_9PEZI
MKSLLLVVLAASSTRAAWLKWSVDSTPTWKPPQETGLSEDGSGLVGWTPKPTQAPGHRTEGEAVLELLRRDTFTTTNWTNSETCGWVSGVSSYPWTCGSDFVCSTNGDHAVACVSEDYQPFFVSCFDFEASQAGSCQNLGSDTGCCQGSTAPACVTYIWTGSPVRSQFKCGTSTAITSMLDEPQFVIDASISASKSSESAASASSASASRASVSASLASEASKSADGSRGSVTTATLSDGSTVTSTADPLSATQSTGTTTNNTNNTGAIVGGAVGGVAGLLLLLLLLFCCCRRRRKSTKNNYKLSYNSKNNEKTTVYNSRREQRNAERARHDRKASRGRSQRSKSGHDEDDDEPYPLGFVDGFGGQQPSAPREAHVSRDDRPVYAPQYHFHVTDGGRNSRESSIVETTRQYRAS